MPARHASSTTAGAGHHLAAAMPPLRYVTCTAGTPLRYRSRGSRVAKRGVINQVQTIWTTTASFKRAGLAVDLGTDRR